MRFYLSLLFMFIFALTGQALCVNAKDGHKLLKAVVLSRHGVRAPTQEAKILNAWSRKPWPAWPVERGELTERGGLLVEKMWENMRVYFSREDLLPAESCPTQNAVYVRADVDERTMATARAILNGIAANCGLGFAVMRDEKVDPLFHPLKAGLYNFNPIEVATQVLAMTRGGLSSVQDRLANKIALLSEILGPPEQELCARFAMTRNCTLGDLPNAISVSPNGEDIRLVGSLSIASSVAEIFLLEYAQWPGELAGWGRVTENILEEVLPVHATIFDIVNRAPIVAWAKGSSLLTEMIAALNGTHQDKRCNEAKLVVFVGHDTNIANIGSLLDLNWQGEGYPENGIPPASALVMELWEKNGAKEVVLRFFTQTPKTLHQDFAPAGEISLFAPDSVPVSFVEERNGKPLTLGEVSQIAAKVTIGAPIAPQTNPPLYFGPVNPTPLEKAKHK